MDLGECYHVPAVVGGQRSSAEREVGDRRDGHGRGGHRPAAVTQRQHRQPGGHREPGGVDPGRLVELERAAVQVEQHAIAAGAGSGHPLAAHRPGPERADGKGRRRSAELVEQRRAGVGRAVNLGDEPGDGLQIGLRCGMTDHPVRPGLSATLGSSSARTQATTFAPRS
jgi:hypothetical protein